MRPLSDQTLSQVSRLVAEILLPFFLFYTASQTATLESLRVAPLLVAMGVLVSILNFGLGGIVRRPFKVGNEQKSAFRFSVLLSNTAFVGFPVCSALFGPTGLLYAVLYDIGLALVTVTLGLWDLAGGRRTDWKFLVLNPLILGTAAGCVWALLGLELPEWVAQPFSALGAATLPLALLVGGARLGSVRSPSIQWRWQLGGLTLTRLIISPLVVASFLAVLSWDSTAADVVIIQNSTPTGLFAAIFVGTYGGDAQFAASATLWSTLAAAVTIPCIVFLLL